MVLDSERNAYRPGCEGVIEIVEAAQGNLAVDERLERLFLGIIDADYRRFLNNEHSEYKGLFMLKYYSYESHFNTDFSIRNFISSVTSATVGEITEEVLTVAKEGLAERLRDLYYVGLEALRSRKISGTKGLVNYDMNPEALYQEKDGKSIVTAVLARKEDLDSFAQENGITIEDGTYIIRGKWLLYTVAKVVYENIGKVKQKCVSGEIKQCDFCRSGISDRCIWGKKEELNRGQLVHKFIYVNLDEPGIGYIKQKISTLGV
jgi:hypothetical protein